MSDWQLSKLGIVEGPVRLDMTAGEVTRALGVAGDVFKRTPEASNEILAFDNFGIHAVIDRDCRVVGVIIFPPNQVWIACIQLLQQPITAIGQKLSAAGFAFDSDASGLRSDALGVVLLDIDGVVDGVQIGISG